MDSKSDQPKPSEDKKDEGMHIETSREKSSDGAQSMCDAAPDKEKCQEFVERLDGAANNIDRKS